MTYRVFIGSWDDGNPDWTTTDVAGLTWDEAKAELQKHLRQFYNDDCETCRREAMDVLDTLRVASPGAFEANVDGDDYMILPE